MNKRLVRLFFCLIPLLALFSCDNELDVTADYKEVVVVYGLLDFGQPQQFIKVNKAFLSEGGDAYIDAQNQDSLFFDSISVKLIDNNGTEINLTKTEGKAKESGVFSNQVNTLFTTNVGLNPNNTYSLLVKNELSDFTASSQTNLVFPPTMRLPFNNNNVEWYIHPDRNIPFQFFSGKNAIVYDLKVRVYYDEMHASDTNIKVEKYLDWPILINKEMRTDEGFELVNTTASASVFFDLLGENLEVDPDLSRRLKRADILTFGGGKEINNYITVSEPSIGIIQKQSNYTNITNGAGIFSSRLIWGVRNIKIEKGTTLFAQTDSRTADLNFIY